jgi:hypothetical protein
LKSLAESLSESTFSRAFAEFADIALPQHEREALIKKPLRDEVIFHNSWDSAAIEVREKAQLKPKMTESSKKKKEL